MNDIKFELAKKLFQKRTEVDAWFLEQSRGLTLPFYNSIDIRDSGMKVVPVDNNLYPAGFNNICPEDRRTAGDVFEKHVKPGTKVLLIPEAHTQNRYYLENIFYLMEILQSGGYEVVLGWPPGMTETPLTLEAANGSVLTAHPVFLENGKLRTKDFVPDEILLNNDFSAGYPKDLDETQQPIQPSHHWGWHTRRKDRHFVHYNRLAESLAKILEIDPWHITLTSEVCNSVNFSDGEGIACVRAHTEWVLNSMKTEYQKRGSSQAPFAYIKSNTGTYGMGIMVVHSVEELDQMNRRTKNKMSVGKGKLAIDSVVVQEGIPTQLVVEKLPSEPVIYLAHGDLLGGFLRSNAEKNSEENLNSQGMVFQKLCMADLREALRESIQDEIPVFEHVYGTIARLSGLAAGFEIREIEAAR